MDIIVLGDGGHSKVIQEIINAVEGYTVFAILDNKYNHPFKKNGIIFSSIKYLNYLMTNKTKVINAIGSNETRKRITEKILLSPAQYATIIHPSAIVSPSVTIGTGTVVMAHVVINAQAKIGMHCIINSSSVIEHESEVSSYAHVSPNATLTGNVFLGEGVHFGAAATTIPGVEIGHWSIVGAGSTVIENIPDYCTAVGSPTKIINRRDRKENLTNKVVMLSDQN